MGTHLDCAVVMVSFATAKESHCARVYQLFFGDESQNESTTHVQNNNWHDSIKQDSLVLASALFLDPLALEVLTNYDDGVIFIRCSNSCFAPRPSKLFDASS